MKITFYNQMLNMVTIIVMNIVFIVFSILVCKLSTLAFIIGIAGFLIGVIILVVFMKKHFYRVEINNKGIIWFFRKNNTVIIKWQEIESINAASEFRTRSIRIYSKTLDNESLYFTAHYFRLRKMIRICPIEDLKIQFKKTGIFYTEPKKDSNGNN